MNRVAVLGRRSLSSRSLLPSGPISTVLFALRLAALATTIARLIGRHPQATRRLDRSHPQVGGGLPIGRRIEGPGVSVVVPARDEAQRIGPCLEALAAMAGVNEVVVVDDQSCDATASVARRLGAHVVAGRELPEGWAGKTWALQQGIDAAAGPVIVTLDADTRPGPGLIEVLLDELEQGADLVTVAGRFDCPTAGSQVVHPALLTTLVYRFGRPGSRGGSDRLLANGQCMAFRKEAFVRDEALQRVRGELVEDVALARALAAVGWQVSFLDGVEHLTVRMFESFAETWTGWGRSIALPGVEPRSRQLTDLAVLGSVQALPILRLLARRADAIDLVALVVRAGTLAGTRRAYVRGGLPYWSSFVVDPLAVLRLASSIVRPSRVWRGRRYPA